MNEQQNQQQKPKKQIKKDLFIHGIQQVEIDQHKNIPTALYYKDSDEYVIGHEALSSSDQPLEINQDFKVDLGHHNSKTSKARQNFPTSCGIDKSAVALTNDFFRQILKKVNRWLSMQQIEESAHIMLAEPLAMHCESDADWLENYRRNIRELLEKRTSSDYPHINFQHVSFLPEPFAVYQYYRYGVHHPLIQSGKHQALIVDFGGGTFDVSVIETTKEGDVSQSGRSSKPLGASSKPIGGFHINRKIAEYLYAKHLIEPNLRDQFKRGLKEYARWRRGESDVNSLKEDIRSFVYNFHRTSFELENAKVTLCKQVSDWGLEAVLEGQTRVKLPSNPFIDESDSSSFPLSAVELRDIFEKKIWPDLMQTVDLCLNRANLDLEGQPITVVLLSGGSANIGWLEKLLLRDFDSSLGGAHTLPLPDFQEVVSKGLAVECARRFFTDAGDFGSVVYNRLCLMLDVIKGDGQSDCRPRSFKPITADLPNNSDQPGVLLQSASVIQSFVDVPLRWKVGQISTQPKRLKYDFLRSSLDPEDTENRLNFEERMAVAPAKCNFDRELKVELLVREDGTAIPKFIYHLGKDDSTSIATLGRPFAIDMTTKSAPKNVKAYIGFDFGTSNSSISFVESRSISEYQKRRSDDAWVELSDVAYSLPYPAAQPLLNYLAQGANKLELESAARQATESMLALLYYSMMVDYRHFKMQNQLRSKTSLFKSLSQRSAGPLLSGLRQLVVEQGFAKKALFSAAVAELFSKPHSDTINKLVTHIAQVKHDKVSVGAVDSHRPLRAIANVCKTVFSSALFGFFEGVRREKFSPAIQGRFRVANGQPPFIRSISVKLDELVAEGTPYLLLPSEGIAIGLMPMLIWLQNPKQPLYEHGDCYLYDHSSKDLKSFSFKAVGAQDALLIDKNSPDLAALLPALEQMLIQDGDVDVLSVIVGEEG